MKLKEKVAWITGAGNGIGKATALLFAKEGATVILTDVDEEAIQTTLEEIKSSGGQALAVAGSVTDPEAVRQMADEAVGVYKRLDILVNNAGINRDGLVVRKKEEELKLMGPEKWDPVIDVNLKGTFLCAQAAAIPMMGQKYGRIVNTSSIGALGNIGQANYAASKAGVIGLTKSLALEWARFNINVNCVAPGGTKTQMTDGIPEKILEGLLSRIPMRRLAEPEEIAKTHLFFVSDDANYITGQVLFVDGGISVGV
jgi:NAD(P)-dependent dehydrogenase (short-subunit alcohol dehydrogenase family)